MATMISSASGILALLDEPEEELQEHALQSLDEIVDVFWTEISESISKMYAYRGAPRRGIDTLRFPGGHAHDASLRFLHPCVQNPQRCLNPLPVGSTIPSWRLTSPPTPHSPSLLAQSPSAAACTDVRR
jgi:hypothetical protein